MSVAKIIEISASSDKSFEDAVERGIKRSGETIDGVRSAWVKDHEVIVEDGAIREYRVHLKVTFVLGEKR